MPEEANAYPILPTIFGTTDIPTYEELKRRRAIATALASRQRGFPKTTGEGLTYLGEAIGEAGLEWRLRQEEARSQGYVRDQVSGAPPVVPPRPIGGTPPPPAAAAPAPARLPGSDPAVPPTLSPAPVSAAPPPEPAPAPVAAAPSVGGDEQPEVASAPDLPAPGVTSSEAPPRSTLSSDGPPPEAIAALKAAMVRQQAEARPPVQPVQPQAQGDVREAITNALMMSPQREAERPQPPMESQPATTAAFQPPAGQRPLTDAPLKITVGGPQNMQDRSIGAYLKPTAVPRGVENLDPKVQSYVAEVSKAFPGVKFTSGYRSPSVNAAVGGATNSEHMRRLAVDMDVSGVPADQRRALIADARMRGAGGLGNYGGNSIHVDFRTGTPVAWGPNRSYTSLGQTPDWFRSEAAAHRTGERPQAVAAAAPPPPAGPQVATLPVRPSPMMQDRPPDQQDAVLQDVLGAGARPGLRGATASLGRAGVASDAGPDSPVGAGIAASVDARRNAITGSLNGQPQPAPAPPSDVQVAQAPGASTVDSGTIFSPRPVKTIPVQGAQPGSDIQKAPATLPSAEAIPGQPPPAAAVAPFQAEPMTARERWLRDKAADPKMPDQYKALFAKEAAELEQDRRKVEDRRWDLHKQDLERYYKNPERELAARVQRLQIEAEQFKATQRPVEAQKALTDLAIAQQNLTKYQRENSAEYVERERLKAQAELANAQRTATKPDSQSAAGTTFERPYAPPGQPQQPYAVPPGLPPPKEERTADQAQANEFVKRVRPDLDLLDNELQMGRVMTVPAEKIRDLPMIGNMTVSEEYRRANQAWTNFEGGFMQRVSGAAVSNSEALRNLPAFKPLPGDTPRELADKSRRRRDFVDAVEQSSGLQGASVIREQIQKASDALYDSQSQKPAVRVNSPGEALLLPPGQRFVNPEGRELVVPRRKVQ